MPPARRIAATAQEQGKAILSIAGFRIIPGTQATIAPGAGAEATYTVLNAACRRVVAIHLGTGNGDIRFELNAAATATKIPVIPARYFIVDVLSPRPATPTEPAKVGDVLHFFNTTGGAITVYLVETE